MLPENTENVTCADCGATVTFRNGAWWCPRHRDESTIRLPGDKHPDQFAKDNALRAARRAIHDLCLERQSTEGYRDVFTQINEALSA